MTWCAFLLMTERTYVLIYYNSEASFVGRLCLGKLIMVLLVS